MAYYDTLATKWATLTGTDAQRIAQLNAMTVAGPNVPVPVLTVMTYLRTNNLWMAIKAATATSNGAAAAVDYNSDPRVQTLDVSLAIVQGMLADLVSHSLLTQAQANAILAMGTTTIPWWQANGYSSPISANDVTAMNNHAAALAAAQAQLAADQAALTAAQNATPVVPATVAALQAAIVNDNAALAKLA